MKLRISTVVKNRLQKESAQGSRSYLAFDQWDELLHFRPRRCQSALYVLKGPHRQVAEKSRREKSVAEREGSPGAQEKLLWTLLGALLSQCPGLWYGTEGHQEGWSERLCSGDNCYGLNVCVPSKFICWNLIPVVIVLERGGTLGGNRVKCSYKRGSRELHPSSMWVHRRRQLPMSQKSGSHQTPNLPAPKSWTSQPQELSE